VQPWLTLSIRRTQTGHLSLTANPTHAVGAYTKASEGWGIPEAQYKLGFLYGSNFANATGPIEGVGEQGSVRLRNSAKPDLASPP
jgi:SEL1 protein